MGALPWRLRELSWTARAGVACLVLTILGGFGASGLHLLFHHQNRDEKPGVSVEDIQGAYHGVKTTSPLLASLRRGHPETLAEQDRKTLVLWLTGTRVSEDYDNLDLGDAAPVEIIGRSCLGCHARKAADAHPIAREFPLDFWDDIRQISVSRQVNPVDTKILAASTHTHALSLAMLTLVAAALALATSWPRRLVNTGIMLLGVTLLADLSAWWISREVAVAVYIVIGAGAAYNSLMALTMLAVLVDVCLPKRG